MKKTKLFYVLMVLLFFQYSCSNNDIDEMGEDLMSCTDGIQNQNETGIDCGGECDACAPSSEYYFKGDFGGESVLTEERGSVTFLGGTNTDAGNNLCSVGYFMAISDIFDTDYVPIVGIGFANVYLRNSNCDYDEIYEKFPTFFDPGTYDFYEENVSGFSKGIAVAYVDMDGKEWNSTNGAQPNLSSFEIMSSESVTPSTAGNLIQKISGKVNCTLYDFNGNSIKLENAEFVFRYSYQ